MNSVDLDFLASIWRQLSETDFQKETLIDLLLVDGGLDISELSRHDLLALMDGTFSGEWRRPAFAFSEMLSHYLAGAHEMSDEHVVGWIFAAFILAEAIEQGATDWEREFNHFLAGLYILQARLEVDDSLFILRRVILSGSKIP